MTDSRGRPLWEWGFSRFSGSDTHRAVKKKTKDKDKDTRLLAVEDDLGGMSGPPQHTLNAGRWRREAEP